MRTRFLCTIFIHYPMVNVTEPDSVPEYILRQSQTLEFSHDKNAVTTRFLSHDAPDTQSGAPPTIPFGLDLKYWGEKDVTPAAFNASNNFDSHRFWRPTSDEMVSCATASDASHYEVSEVYLFQSDETDIFI